MRNFNVKGMNCAACSARVERAVMALDGIESCSVNLLSASMCVEGNASDQMIILAVEKAGYSASVMRGVKETSDSDDSLARKERKRILNRLVLSAVLLVFLMYFSMGRALGLPLPDFISSRAAAQAGIQLALATAVLVINRSFFINGTRAIVRRVPNMDTLVALGSFASYAYSTWGVVEMLIFPTRGVECLHDLYFESAAMIPVLITLGKLLESMAKKKTTGAIEQLMRLSPSTAVVLRGGKEICIPTDEVIVGDVFVVRPGERIPADGEVIEGESAVDESMLTGESIPNEKSLGSSVYAATLNKSGYLKCRATSVGEGTTISGIIKLVSDATATKAPIAKLADKVAGIFVPVVLAIAIASVGVWLLVGETVGFALARGISVLVISCPCALGLATPVAVMVGSGVGAKRGILFKSASAIEASGRVRYVALDKTGTITEGRPRVAKMTVFGEDEAAFLTLACSIEAKSEHPLAEAVCELAEEKGIAPKEVTGFVAVPGGGVQGVLDGVEVIGGNLEFTSLKATLTTEACQIYREYASIGMTPLLFASGGRVTGIIGVRDRIKGDSFSAIEKMQRMGIKVIMLTGDNEITANSVAKESGVDTVIAGVLPDGKEQTVRELSEKGTVMMVGDGINDAPALARADVGVAIGRGADIAVDSADVVLTGSSLMGVVTAIRLGRSVLRNIKQNLFWAFCYNIVGIPLAAGAFISLLGWEMSPMLSAAAMSVSSLLVVSNALRLNLFKDDRGCRI